MPVGIYWHRMKVLFDTSLTTLCQNGEFLPVSTKKLIKLQIYDNVDYVIYKITRHMTQLIKPLRNGQITIPAQFRQRLGIDTESLLQITLEGEELHIKPVKVAPKTTDGVWLKKLYDHFNKVRKEAKAYGEKEIDKSIDQAIKAVRKSQ